jgi:hypothetical protein
MKKEPNKLAIRVRGVNKANARANKLYDELIPIFKPLVGKPLFKVTGGLFEKYKKLVPDFPYGHGLPQIYRNSSNYSLSYTVKTWEAEPSNIPGHSDIGYYHETTVYIGDLQNGVLTKLYDPPNFKTDYNAADIAAKREAYQKAKEAADKAQSALFPFGEYDR